MVPLCFGFLLLVFVGSPLVAAEDWPTRRADLDQKYVAKLNELAQEARTAGLTAEAKLAESWFVTQTPGRHFLFVPRDATIPSDDAPADVKRSATAVAWQAEFDKLRRFYAAYLVNFAREALKADQPSAAYRLVNQALREDPNNAAARKILQFQRDETSGRWVTDFAARQLKAGRFDHARFGWITQADARKYDAGLRRVGTRWVAEEEAARLIGSRIERGWQVETEHFTIQSSDTLEATVQLGRRLEDLHLVWRQLFAEYWFPPAELERLFAGEPTRFAEPKHKVMLFPDKQQYVDYLIDDVPNIAMSLGYYAEKTKTTYLYAGDSRAVATWFHEATHQLFHERQRRPKTAGDDANFWVVEGAATYMESLTPHDGYYTVGGPGSYRLQFARYRALTEGYYIPLGELSQLGRRAMQARGGELPRLYSQSAGLAHFFLDGDQAHRRGFVEYLNLVYRDRADATTLARQTKQTFAELDAAYFEFLKTTDADLAALLPGENVPRLYLGKTLISDRGLAAIDRVTGLQRLDVGFTRITNAGVKALSPRASLIQLNLESTAIDDDALPHVAKFASLRELDLSGCKVSDQGLTAIAQLPNLQVLWLTNTQVSDAGLAKLHGLKQLKFIDIDGSRVSAEGWAALKNAVPGVSREQE